MSIDKYIKGLLPSIGRDEIIARIASIEKSIQEDTLPPYEAAARALSTHAFSDPFLVKFEQRMNREMDSSHRGNFLSKIRRVLDNQSETLKIVQQEIEKHKGRSIAKSAITYSTLQAMKILDTVDFLNKYARSLLIYTLAVETASMRQGGVDLRLSKAQIRELKEKPEHFIRALIRMDFGKRSLKVKLEEIPRIEVDETNLKEQMNMMGRSKLDPTGIFSDGLILQTVYPIRRMVADWQETRRQAAIEERKLLEYQIMDLKSAMDGSNDPKVQRHLEYSEKRMRELNQKLAKMEE